VEQALYYYMLMYFMGTMAGVLISGLYHWFSLR